MRSAWDKFWFKPIDARQYALLRILFGGLSAVYFVELWPYLPTQFSADGWLGTIGQIESFNGGSWSLFFIDFGKHSLPMAYGIAGVGILSSLLLTVGWRSRLSALITWLVWVSLWNRNPLILDGDDAVLKLMCFYLLLAPCGSAWSVAAYQGGGTRQVPVWPLRLIQFQIALIYFVSGWVKLHSPEWEDGAVLQYVLIHPHYSRWDGRPLLDYEVIRDFLDILADSIRWWEVLFPFLLLNRITRMPCLWVGVFFHLGLFMTMNLRWFPWVMLALYPALIPTETFQVYADKLEGLIAKRISAR